MKHEIEFLAKDEQLKMKINIIKIIIENANAQLIMSSDRLKEDLGMDSLDIAVVGDEIEEFYDIKLPDDIFNCITVQDLIDFVIDNFNKRSNNYGRS